jgi:hypothetical protein
MVTAFVSLMLVIAGVVLFVSRAKAGDFEHGDRLSLLPLADDEGTGAGDAGEGPDAALDSEPEENVHPTTGGTA